MTHGIASSDSLMCWLVTSAKASCHNHFAAVITQNNQLSTYAVLLQLLLTILLLPHQLFFPELEMTLARYCLTFYTLGHLCHVAGHMNFVVL